MRFLNAELIRVGRGGIGAERVLDTLALARRKHPGSPNSLDALCDRFRIDRSHRIKHGALLDAEILVEVYSELSGGRQRSLLLTPIAQSTGEAGALWQAHAPRPAPLPPRATAREAQEHWAHVADLGAGALWNAYALAPEGYAAAIGLDGQEGAAG